MTNVTSIQIPVETRDRLRRFGFKGQTYNDILNGLMDRVEHDAYMAEQYRRLEERDKFSRLE